MIFIKQIKEEDIDLCYELDLSTISLWSKKQWANEFRKEGIKVFGLLFANILIGVCVFQVILDEAQLNYIVVDREFRERGHGSYFMNYIIKHCESLKIKKILLEVSTNNTRAKNFYNRFKFSTVGIRKNYYKDGSDAILKEKKLLTK